MLSVHAWVMWFFAGLFFAYQFIIRVFFGLCMPEVMDKFHIDATDFGLLSSMYYYGYAGVQIPVALLLDKYGPRVVISSCCFICAASIFLFFWTDNWILALLSRFLIGAGSAAGFLGASKIISLWFPFRVYARMLGITFTFGLLGAVYGGKPVGHLIGLYGWETLLLIMGSGGLILAVLLILIISPYKSSFVHESPSFFRNFRALFTMPVLLLIAAANFLMVGPLEGFADVWGVSYLMNVYVFEKSDAALITSAVFTGMMIGGPFVAYLTEKLKISYGMTAFCGIGMAGLFAVMILAQGQISFTLLYIMMFIVGILCCYQLLVFSIGTAYVPEGMRGITVAFLNCINMLGGSFFHTVIGTLMDFFWTGNVFEGQRVYETYAYDSALWSIPLAALLGGTVFLFLIPFQKREDQTVN